MDVHERVLFQNKHWGQGKFETFNFKRYLFSKIWKDIETKPITLLTGPRRTGKSVIVKQLINEVVNKNGVNPRQVLFYEFSQGEKTEVIWQVFDYFSKEVADPRLPIYLFFDEIQYIKDYEIVLKQIYDNTQNCKIITTGSLSLSYKRKMQESLAGRFFSYHLYPLNFSEYLELAKPDSFRIFKEIEDIKDNYKKQSLLEPLNVDFREFLLCGRFPETVNFTKDQVQAYLKNIISQSLNQDVFSYFEIEKPLIINAIFEYIRQNNGGVISINKLANNLGASNQTVTLYLDILDQMGIIYLVYNNLNPLVKTQCSKKAYTNSSFALLETKLDIQTATGIAVESYILERLLEKNEMVTFWRKRNKEIDFILPKKKIGFEVKFRTQPPHIKNTPGEFNIKILSLNGEYPACLF